MVHSQDAVGRPWQTGANKALRDRRRFSLSGPPTPADNEQCITRILLLLLFIIKPVDGVYLMRWKGREGYNFSERIVLNNILAAVSEAVKVNEPFRADKHDRTINATIERVSRYVY